MNLTDLKFEYRLATSGDVWGDCMEWLFTIADEIYFNRDFDVPEDWQFRPSPLGPSNEEDAWPVAIVKDADDSAILAFGNILNRYAAALKRAGRDY